MALKVLRFSQEASLEDPKDMRNFLVLGDGKIEIRVEVSPDDIKKVIHAVFGLAEKTKPDVEDEDIDDPPKGDELVDAQDQADVYEDQPTHNQLANGVDEDGIESL